MCVATGVTKRSNDDSTSIWMGDRDLCSNRYHKLAFDPLFFPALSNFNLIRRDQFLGEPRRAEPLWHAIRRY
ncbi:hypothetical protein LMG26686_02763 [Achromobacter mucicolens]|nr:hypothetical protein LMG26686_02763 [Achromobacter mucicolens]